MMQKCWCRNTTEARRKRNVIMEGKFAAGGLRFKPSGWFGPLCGVSSDSYAHSYLLLFGILF